MAAVPRPVPVSAPPVSLPSGIGGGSGPPVTPVPLPSRIGGGSGPPVTPPPPRPPSPPPAGQPSARSTAIAAARAEATAAPRPGQQWQPWAETVIEAEARMKREIAAALKGLDVALAAAQQVLDGAEQIAGDIAGQLEGRALAAWHKYMAEAKRSADRVLAPARSAYDQAVSAASAEYAAALDEAGKSYAAAVAAADTARTRAAAFARP